MASLTVPVVGASDGSAPQFLTLNPDAEPMRLESLCVQCMQNVCGQSIAQPSRQARALRESLMETQAGRI